MTTVKELIEFLQSQPQHLRVLIVNCESGYDDIDLKNTITSDVFIDAGETATWGGQHEQANHHIVYVNNDITKENEAYQYNETYKDWERCQSFNDPSVFPSSGGEWAWSNGENRWVRISPPETRKPDCIPWPIEKALILN